ncbi:MAG: hypothetical protein MJ125_06820 [Clostridia bacterium]|nr:hypothetical protein [Clostridia bacterium]
MFEKIIALLMSVISAIGLFFFDISDNYTFEVDASDLGEVIGNKASNINLWEVGRHYYGDDSSNKDNIYDFVEYVQLMQCTGGNSSRDLLKNPEDRTVLDDYDFTKLITNCHGILKVGAKPCLKIGNVPEKFSAKSYSIGFDVNVLPPDDYNVYYDYIKAMAQALVDEFGRDEVLTWHFTCFTEYENYDWFKCDTPEETAEATCKMYDYIVDALQTTIGENVYVGAHSMTVTEGGWNEGIFIQHCAQGTNYKTGKKGTRICCLSASYYENEPGKVGTRKSLSETIGYLQSCAKKYGLENVDFGIDEGRVLSGNTSGFNKSDLVSRTVGYTWQAAYDAKIYGTLIDIAGSYLSSWSYKSDGLNKGVPTVSYHVAKHISEFASSLRVKVTKVLSGLIPLPKANVYAGFDEGENVLHIMAYNYKNQLDYSRKADLKLKINVPQFDNGEVTVTKYVINDDCNFFDEWVQDRKDNNLTDDLFDWSPDCPCIGGNGTRGDVMKVYNENKEKYYKCAELIPVSSTEEVVDGKLEINESIGGNNVIFYEITQ